MHRWNALFRSSLAVGAWLAHVATRAHDFVDEKELLAENGRNVQELPFNDVIVPNVGFSCWQGFSSQYVNSESLVLLDVCILHLDQRVLRIES